MRVDTNLAQLPLTKSKPETLISLFGNKDAQPMWVADMEFEVARPIQEALIQRVTGSSFGYEYKPASFFEAQKAWYQKHYQVDLINEQIIYSPSITTAMAVVIEQLTSEGDGVIIQPPVFMEFKDVIRHTHRALVKNPLKLIDDTYEIDFEHLEELARVEQNKVLILCSPHNPVGRIWSKKDLQTLITICNDNNLALIVDEVHKDIILFKNKFISILSYANQIDKLVLCTSEAKTFNLCGISDAMTVIPDQTLRQAVRRSFQKYNLGRTNALTRVAQEAAYLHGDTWLKALLETIEQNVQLIETELKNAKSKIHFKRPEATYQVWLDFRNVFKDSKEMFDYLTKEAKIGLNAGHWFGREGALFMRMNIASSSENVRKAIRKLIEAAAKY